MSVMSCFGVRIQKAEPITLDQGDGEYTLTFDHYMLTIGSERAGVRITRGSLSRHGKWRSWCPNVFFLWRGRRAWTVI